MILCAIAFVIIIAEWISEFFAENGSKILIGIGLLALVSYFLQRITERWKR